MIQELLYCLYSGCQCRRISIDKRLLSENCSLCKCIGKNKDFFEFFRFMGWAGNQPRIVDYGEAEYYMTDKGYNVYRYKSGVSDDMDFYINRLKNSPDLLSFFLFHLDDFIEFAKKI